MCGGNVAGVQERIAGLLSSSRSNDGTRKTQTKKKKISNFFSNYKLRLARPFLASSALSLLNEARALNDFGS